MTLMLLYLF